MTTEWTDKRHLASTIGGRISSHRRASGLSVKELVARIENPKLTAKVLYNIESGVKVDLSISQLLEIAFALGIEPLHLLVDIRRPYEPTQIPHLSGELAKMSTINFIEWVTAPYLTHPLLDSTTVKTAPESFDLMKLREFELLRRIAEHHALLLGKAIRTNRMFPDHIDIDVLRARLATSLDQLRDLQEHLRSRGIDIPDDVIGHILATASMQARDQRDPHDPDDSLK